MTKENDNTAAAGTQVLLIEDAEAGAPVLQELLVAAGVTVLRAQNGAQAVELMNEHDFVLAVIGVGSAGSHTHGLDVARHLRNTLPCSLLPLLFVCASAEDSQRVLTDAIDGTVDVLTAPVSAQLLRRKLALFAELHEQRRQFHAQRDDFVRVLKLNAMMIAVLTHDLRTPMTAVELSAEIVQKRAESETLSKAAKRIKSSIARMSETIHHLLSVSKVGSDLVPVHPVPTDLKDVAAEAINEFQAARPQANIELEAVGDTQAVFDPQRLAQVFSNLIGLAVEHGDADSLVSVTIDGGHRAYLRVRVRTPAVFPESVSASLFTAPSRPGAPPTMGVGLGLSIVEQLVRAHGGTVIGVSEPIHGSVFDVMLPRVETAPAEA